MWRSACSRSRPRGAPAWRRSSAKRRRAAKIEMDRGAFGVAVVAHDVSEARDDGPGFGMGREVYLHLDALAYLVRLHGLQQYAGDAQVEHLRRLPVRVCERPHAGRPLDAMSARTSNFETFHLPLNGARSAHAVRHGRSA